MFLIGQWAGACVQHDVPHPWSEPFDPFKVLGREPKRAAMLGGKTVEAVHGSLHP